MINQESLSAAIKRIQNLRGYIAPKVGLILGSGLGVIAEQMTDAIKLPYTEVPGMPVSTVPGHAGCFVFGKIQGIPAVCMNGRVHWYEGMQGQAFKFYIRLLKMLGCRTLILTNSAGSLRKTIGPGELVLIQDHINFQALNPLVGPNDEEFGPRFFPMDDAYDPEIRADLKNAAAELGFPLHEGVYFAVQGPNFETPAEIRAFRALGADVVGMSTVPEVLVARHCGLRVALISNITNLSSDLSEEQLTHEGTLHYSQKAVGKMVELLTRYLKNDGHRL